MNDDQKKGEDELALDWEDAVEAFGRDLDVAAEAKSAPIASSHPEVALETLPPTDEDDRPTVFPGSRAPPPEPTDAPRPPKPSLAPQQPAFTASRPDTPKADGPKGFSVKRPMRAPKAARVPSIPQPLAAGESPAPQSAPKLPPPSKPANAQSQRTDETTRRHAAMPPARSAPSAAPAAPSPVAQTDGPVECPTAPPPPLYQPPSLDEIASQREPAQTPSPQDPETSAWALEADSDATQIAMIPPEIMQSLVRGDFSEPQTGTVAAPVDVELMEQLQDRSSPAPNARTPVAPRPSDPEFIEEIDAIELEDDELDFVLPLDSDAQSLRPDGGTREADPPPPEPSALVTRLTLDPSLPDNDDSELDEDDLRALDSLREMDGPPESEPSALAVAPSGAPPLPDRGADVALHTVRARRAKDDPLPASGLDAAGKRARIDLLRALASQRDGKQAMSLFLSAGALAEELEDAAEARELYGAAAEAAPSHSGPLRALARLALSAQDLVGYEAALDRSTAPSLPVSAQAHAHACKARVAWLLRGDPSAALPCALRASELCPQNGVYALLTARLILATGEAPHAPRLLSLSRTVSDPSLAAGLASAAGALFAFDERHADAADAFEEALERKPEAVDAALLLTRARSTTGDDLLAARKLQQAAQRGADGAAQVAVRRRAAFLLGARGAVTEALDALADASDEVSLRTRFELTLAERSPASLVIAANAWGASAQGDTTRAIALVTEAKARLAQDDEDGALAALKRCLSVAPSLTLAQVMVEQLAQRRGDPSLWKTLTLDHGDRTAAWTAAAELADHPEALADEVAALETAVREDGGPGTPAVLLDACLAQHNFTRARELLSMEAEQGAIQKRKSSLLARADLERRSGDRRAEGACLVEANQLDPEAAVTNRALARHLLASHPGDAALAYGREAEAAAGLRASWAGQQAAELIKDDPGRRLLTLKKAHEACSAFRPAFVALCKELRQQGELAELAELYARQASRASDPESAARHSVRAALLHPQESAQSAHHHLQRALDFAPEDPVLRELLLQSSQAVPRTLRAEALGRAGEAATGELGQAYRLLAAAAYLDADRPDLATKLLRELRRETPDCASAELGWERAARTSGDAEEWLESKRMVAATTRSDRERQKALEDLLALGEDATPETACEGARALLDLHPDHPAALRVLERRAMDTGDARALAELEGRMVSSSQGPADILARLRMLFVLAARELAERVDADDLDRLVLEQGPRARKTPWLLRQLISSAITLEDGTALAAAVADLAERDHAPHERAALFLQRAHLATEPEAVERLAQSCLDDASDNSVALELLAEARRAQDDLEGAAARFEEAGAAAKAPSRRARLWLLAGQLWQAPPLQDAARAREAYKQAAAADLSYGDVLARLREACGDEANLSELTELTVAALSRGGSKEHTVRLKRTLAKLQAEQGEREQAIATLREALALAPEDLSALHALANLLEGESEHRAAASALINIARLSSDGRELRDVFLRLGAIYEEKLPDARRAEAAYRRALKLGPHHPDALRGLVRLLRRDGQLDQAREALRELVEAVDAPDTKAQLALELATLQAEQGDLPAAKRIVESLDASTRRRPELIAGLADLYSAHDPEALATHLQVSAGHLRDALSRSPKRGDLWAALASVFARQGRRDAAQVTAAAARALGVSDPGLSGATEEVAGVESAAFSELLDDLVFPSALHPAVRVVLRHGADALNRVAPFDLAAVDARPLPEDHPLGRARDQVCAWLGLEGAQIYVSRALPRAFVPVQDAPVQLLVGEELLSALTLPEQLFLTARALKVARAHMSIACRVRPDEMALLIHALLRSQKPDYRPQVGDSDVLAAMTGRVEKHLGKPAQAELTAAANELAGVADFSPEKLYTVASTAGNRAALLATGSPAAGLSALGKLSGLPLDERLSPQAVWQVEEARDLLNFMPSDAHFEARQRAGAEQR